MTGYGRAECDLKNMVYNIEIKSLNSKQLDTSVKVPVPLREKELEIRNMLNGALHRGKVEIGIYHERHKLFKSHIWFPAELPLRL